MEIKKYLKAIIISLISIIVFTSITLQPGLFQAPGISNFLPGNNASAQYFYIFTMIWVGPIISTFFGYLLAPLFLIVHKKTIGRKMIYGIGEIKDLNPNKLKDIFKGLFPALMALNFAILVSEATWGSNLITATYLTGTVEDTILIIMITLAITPSIAVVVFSPVWFLQDSGIIYSNQEKAKNKPIPPEVRSVGSWYLYILKVYAGISVIFSFYIIINNIILAGTEFGGFFVQMLLPILITLFMIPTFIILDITWDQRKKYMLKWANKFKITDNIQVSFEVI